MGGIRVFLESLEERNNDASQIQKLTKQILEIQIQNKEKDEALKDIQTKLESLQLENYPATKKMAEEADRVGKRGLSISRISMWLAVFGILLTILLEMLKHFRLWSS